MLNELELTGRARTHVMQRDDLGAALHPAVIEPFLAMREAAAREGIELAVYSGFRDFDTQRRIWNQKFRGERPLYDERGNVRGRAGLGADALIGAILAWSALPGASRHHWGSDLDVIDRAAMPPDYQKCACCRRRRKRAASLSTCTGGFPPTSRASVFFSPTVNIAAACFPSPGI